MNDLRVMRGRHEDLAADLDSGDSDAPELGSAARLAQTATVSSYPTTANVFYAIQFVDVQGEEQEGAAATYIAVGTTKAFALNLGSAVPPTGTTIVVHAVGGRWCFRFDG